VIAEARGAVLEIGAGTGVNFPNYDQGAGSIQQSCS
jgi:hypothetical protein